jgi:DNA (cytosine-5)-methyltransferase 1
VAQPSLFDDAAATRPTPAQEADSYEQFLVDHGRQRIVRTVRMRDGSLRQSSVAVLPGQPLEDPRAAYDYAWLRTAVRPKVAASRGTVRVADLFSGCGLMTLGVAEACRALELTAEVALAVDRSGAACDVYAKNFETEQAYPVSIETLLDREVREPFSPAERELRRSVGSVDVLVGGPPCQGHSDLNNRTRRKDDRNELSLRMARFAEVVGPEHIFLENVRGIQHDRGRALDRTRKALLDLGYHVDGGIVRIERLGVPQHRHRYVLIASKTREVSLETLLAAHYTPERSFEWACAELADAEPDTDFNTPSRPSTRNANRIAYLFGEGKGDHNLPNNQRPKCHRKPHSYRSVYGRLWWDRPAQTITTGFTCMGQGRFVHPTRPRTLTPHEAARLQFAPDFFDFSGVPRVALTEMIGNAVPPKLTYALTLGLLR